MLLFDIRVPYTFLVHVPSHRIVKPSPPSPPPPPKQSDFNDYESSSAPMHIIATTLLAIAAIVALL